MRGFSRAVLALFTQGAVGAFWAIVAVRFWAAGRVGWPRADAWAFPVLIGILASALLGLLLSLVRLWHSRRSARTPLKLRNPWSAREFLFAFLFLIFACATAPIKFFPIGIPFLVGAADGIAAFAGFLAVWSMAEAYRLRAAPPWNRWVTRATFFTTTLLVGVLAAGVGLAFGPAPPDLFGAALGYAALAALGFLLAQALIAFVWIKGLTDGSPETQVAADHVLDDRRSMLIARMILAGVATLASAAAAFSEWAAPIGLCAAFACALASEVLGRVLFDEARIRESP